MISSEVFAALVWVLGPASAAVGFALVVFWLVDEIRKGMYRAKE